MARRLRIAFGLALLTVVLAACAAPPEAATTDHGYQPLESIAPGSDVRVRDALLGPQPPVSGLAAHESGSGWVDDVVSAICENAGGNGVYVSTNGQRRLWTSPDLTVESFAGAFGAVSAATAVEQVKSRFTCTEYTADPPENGRMMIPNQDQDGWHRDIRRVEPPPLKGVESTVFFCETVREVNKRCYAALARKDIVSRLTVTAVTTERAEQVTRSLLDETAARLVAATPQ